MSEKNQLYRFSARTPSTTPFFHSPKSGTLNYSLLQEEKQKRGSSATTFFLFCRTEKESYIRIARVVPESVSFPRPSVTHNKPFKLSVSTYYLRIAAQAPDAQNEKYPSHTPPYNDNYHDINCLSLSDNLEL